MPIHDRNLKPGAVLLAGGKYAGRTCNVETRDGKTAFVLDTGEAFSSPSAAGGAVTASACNGWKFWSVEGEAAPERAERVDAPTRNEKRARQREADVHNLQQKVSSSTRASAPATPRADPNVCVDCGVDLKKRGDAHWHDSHAHYTPHGLKPGTVCHPCTVARGFSCDQQDAAARLARKSQADRDAPKPARKRSRR